jgi:hypothetical protein
MMKSEVRAALAEGWKLVFVDEAMFTTAAKITHSYALKNTNVTVDERATTIEALAVVVGVSRESGIESYLIQKKSINSQAFIRFLEMLIERNPGTKLALFADNCTVHHSKLVK